jgi:hypothetical protein
MTIKIEKVEAPKIARKGIEVPQLNYQHQLCKDSGAILALRKGEDNLPYAFSCNCHRGKWKAYPAWDSVCQSGQWSIYE